MRASRLGDEFGAFDAVMPSRTRRRGPAPRSHRAAWPVTTSVCTPPLGPLLAVANEDLPPLTASGTFCYGARTSGRSPCPGLGGRHRASPTRRARAASFILRLRLVTSQGSPYPSRSPRAHPSGWTRTQGLSRMDSHAPPFFGTPPIRMWNWPLAPLLQRGRKSSWPGERELQLLCRA